MDNIVNIFTSPTKVFTNLKEKPKWVTPFIIVLIAVALSAAFTVSVTSGSEEMRAKQEEAMRDRGMTDEQIEQAIQFTEGPLPMVFGGIGGGIVVAIVLVLFTVILNLFIPLFGGKSGFINVFSVVCFSALVTIPGIIIKMILIGVTKSPYVATSLALVVPNLAKTSFLYQFLNGFDFFIIWEMILVSIGISITNDIKRNSAYVLVFIIWLISIFVGVGLQSLGGGRMG